MAVATYGLVQAVGGLLLLAVWHHSTQNCRWVVATLPGEWIRRTELAPLIKVVVFAVSIPIAFVASFVSMLRWIFMIIGGRRFILKRRTPRRRPTPPIAAP